MTKHVAPASIKTVFIESAHQEIFGEHTPDRNGRHRNDTESAA